MKFIVELILAIAIPFVLMLEWYVFVWLGADEVVATFLTIITVALIIGGGD